jgi:hypothetical protein
MQGSTVGFTAGSSASSTGTGGAGFSGGNAGGAGSTGGPAGSGTTGSGTTGSSTTGTVSGGTGGGGASGSIGMAGTGGTTGESTTTATDSTNCGATPGSISGGTARYTTSSAGSVQNAGGQSRVRGTRSLVTGGRSVVSVTPYAGYLSFGDLFEFGGNVEYSNENSPLYGVQLGLDLLPAVSLVGNFAYASTKFVFEMPNATTNQSVDDVGFWLYDASLHVKAPAMLGMGVLAPFLQGGVGAARYTTSNSDIRSAGNNYVAFNAGVGTDLTFGGVGIRLMALDYMTSLGWESAGDIQAHSGKQIAHNWAFTAGLKLGF